MRLRRRPARPPRGRRSRRRGRPISPRRPRRPRRSAPPGAPAPLYVVGTEVPPPGRPGGRARGPGRRRASRTPSGRLDAHPRGLRATRASSAAWRAGRSPSSSSPASSSATTSSSPTAGRARRRSRPFAERRDGLVFEAHSTDYQAEEALRALVEDHFAILKVGPELTFAFREAVFALEAIERELLGRRRGGPPLGTARRPSTTPCAPTPATGRPTTTGDEESAAPPAAVQPQRPRPATTGRCPEVQAAARAPLRQPRAAAAPPRAGEPVPAGRRRGGRTPGAGRRQAARRATARPAGARPLRAGLPGRPRPGFRRGAELPLRCAPCAAERRRTPARRRAAPRDSSSRRGAAGSSRCSTPRSGSPWRSSSPASASPRSRSAATSTPWPTSGRSCAPTGAR